MSPGLGIASCLFISNIFQLCLCHSKNDFKYSFFFSKSHYVASFIILLNILQIINHSTNCIVLSVLFFCLRSWLLCVCLYCAHYIIAIDNLVC